MSLATLGNDEVKADSRTETASKDCVYDVGDYIELSDKRRGYIRFKGSVSGFGPCVGVELDITIPNGNNGTFMDTSHFECDDGKGTFVKITKITSKCIATPKSQKKTVAKKTSSKPKALKSSKKALKASKTLASPKSKTSKSAKKNRKTASKSERENKSKTKTKSRVQKSPSGRSRGAKNTNKKQGKNKLEIPKNKSCKDQIKYVLSNLGSTKSAFKQRVTIMKQCCHIIEDEKFNDDAAKFAIDSYKKPFVTQLSDKKAAVQKEAIMLVQSLLRSHSLLFKKQTPHYLKNILQTFKSNETRVAKAADSTIKLMVTLLSVEDKQLSIIVAEFIREATTSKNQNVRKVCWAFVSFALVTIADNKRKLPKVVAEVLQSGLKNGISRSNKQTQSAAMKALKDFSLLDETRAERVISRMSGSTLAAFRKITGNARSKRTNSQQLNLMGLNRKKSSKSKSKSKSMKKTKSPKTPGTPKKTPRKTKNSAKGSKSKNKTEKKAAGTKNKGKKTKTKTKTKKEQKSNEQEEKDGDSKDNTTNGELSRSGAIIEMSSTDDIDDRSATDSVGIDAVVEDTIPDLPVENDNTNSNENNQENGNDSVSRKKRGRRQKSKPLMGDVELGAFIPRPPDDDDDDDDDDDNDDNDDQQDLARNEEECAGAAFSGDSEEGGEMESNDDDDDDDDDVDSDDAESAENKKLTSSMNDSGTIEEARDLITSFLELKDPQVNWKMIEFLSKDNMTHLLMSYISRFSSGPKIWVEDLDVDFSISIPETLPLYSNDEDEIRATQLSYSLMRILSNEHAAETVKSFLLRKCQEICLHALAVFHPRSKGNVYHGRVVLEILLNHWPKSFMSALANQRHIQTLLKVALFRNLHQGNLNSFFLDLICFRPNQKMGQIQPVKKKLMKMFVEWKFMKYLLDAAASSKHGDDVATKYATFFIDMVARCASIPEAGELFEGYEHYIIDTFMKGLLNDDESRSTWHRISCGQTLVQFLDISSRPTIMDPAQAMAGMLGVVPPDPNPNILHPMFEDSLKQLHSYIPQMCNTITKGHVTPYLPAISLASGQILRPFGQVRLNCLELLTVSADFAQFKCGTVLSMLPLGFWEAMLDMAFVHHANNMFLCHFRRLIHLSMIFRRRFLKHLFVNCKMLERFAEHYETSVPRSTLHGYVLQMLWDVYNHDQRDEDEDEINDDNNNNAGNEDDNDKVETGSVEIIIGNEDEDEEQNEAEGDVETTNKPGVEEFTEEDLILRPNFSKEPKDQWDIVAFFDNNTKWKEFFTHVSRQMDFQNATEQTVPNMNVANNQQQLDALLTNLLGGSGGPDDDEDDSSSTDSSDSDGDI